MSRMTGLLVYCNTEWISGSTYYSACYPDHHIWSAYPSYCPVFMAMSCTLDSRYFHLQILCMSLRAHCGMPQNALLIDLSLLDWSQGMSLVAPSIAASRNSWVRLVALLSYGASIFASYRAWTTAIPLSNETHPKRRVWHTHFVLRISLAFHKEDV